jgi:SpoVK/Ycf46/Vps4 family AAA+-type ATPase
VREQTAESCRSEGCCGNPCIWKDNSIDTVRQKRAYQDWNALSDSAEDLVAVSDDDCLLFTRRVYAYVLRNRKWVTLDLDKLEDVAQREDGFSDLVLPSGHKETLLALVKTHSKAEMSGDREGITPRQVDLVQGKGKGIIILLHGEPGVGKTSTAECIAQYTRRPLFQVTCGDIGQTAEDVERRLENHFQLAHKWGCVLLLDEADVFLMSRSKADLDRNAIVSVFLRVLEYYSGILFLTTNRVGTFDPAFRSRIHMSLYYPRLSKETSMQIWKNNLRRTKMLWGDKLTIEDREERDIIAYAEERYEKLHRYGTVWNGRQIRNAFQTAIALAEYEAHEDQKKYKSSTPLTPSLCMKNFRKVAEASDHFDKYIREVAGTQEDIARERQERRDDLQHSDLEDMGDGGRGSDRTNGSGRRQQNRSRRMYD